MSEVWAPHQERGHFRAEDVENAAKLHAAHRKAFEAKLRDERLGKRL